MRGAGAVEASFHHSSFIGLLQTAFGDKCLTLALEPKSLHALFVSVYGPLVRSRPISKQGGLFYNQM